MSEPSTEDAFHEPILSPLPRKRTWIPKALRARPELNDRHKALAVFEAMNADLSDGDYWTLLGHVWIDAPRVVGDHDRQYMKRFRALFESKRRLRKHLM